MMPTNEELLTHRAVSMTAAPAEWDALREIGTDDPDVWRRVVRALEDECRLRHGVRASVESADAVELPDLDVTPARRTPRRPSSGWLAAAVIAIAWLVHDRAEVAVRSSLATGDVAVHPTIDPTETAAPDAELARGEVIGELPTMLLATRPSATGEGVDVICLRRTLERVEVDQLFRLATDEHGAPTPSPIAWTPVDMTEQM